MKRLALILIALVAVLALAACGGGEPEPQNVNLTFDGTLDLKFDPATASVPSGANVQVTFNSEGLEHNWILVPGDADATAADVANRAVGGATSGLVQPGESATFRFTAPPAGTYQYVCDVPGHAAAGMVGTLTVTE